VIRRRTIVGGALLLACIGTACEPYRVEYRRRPAYYAKLTEEPLPDRVELEDGTVIVYQTGAPPATGALSGGEEAKVFKIREETEDGEVTLRALLPEHVLANFLHCLRYEEYELIWDQILAERAKREYELEGRGFADFIVYCRKHRVDLARTANRMRLGLVSNETVVESAGDGVIICRFWPQVAQMFKFRRVAMVREGFGLKLLSVG
jgi:hypothetical protein